MSAIDEVAAPAAGSPAGTLRRACQSRALVGACIGVVRAGLVTAGVNAGEAEIVDRGQAWPMITESLGLWPER